MMSEKKKEKEKEKEMEDEEEVLLHYWDHEHPLTLVETSREHFCYGCQRVFRSGEQRYGCSKKCGFERELHRECAETAMKIRHPMHPQHTLIQKRTISDTRSCDVCGRGVYSCIGYYCTIPECLIAIHIECGQDMGVTDSEDDEHAQGGMIIRHGSHPRHKLKLLRRSCSFKCDACGTTHRGSSYACSLCQYWINERCASLDKTMNREDHPHSLSLSFGVPREYKIEKLKCDVCDKDLVSKYWVYHCRLCWYVVHVKCAFKKKPDYTTINYGEDIIRFPINDVAEQLFRPFITRQGGTIPPISNENAMVNAKYDFHGHKHQLSLISSSNEEKDNIYSSDDDDGTTSELICDGCITPILKKKNDQTSSDSAEKCYYMSCSECKYFLHYECFHLPPRLPSLPLLHEANHSLVLQSCGDKNFEMYCEVCSLRSNGLFYTSEGGDFKVDIKCASMPDTIYHAAHPQHLLKLVNCYSSSINISYASGNGNKEEYGYVCYDCEFIVYINQLLLPTSTKNHEWDKKHPLMLTLDARPNHRDEFYCDQCEIKMHPKMWMYHCRDCDLCFHPNCFPAASGVYRNIKFGKKYVNEAFHPHPLTYQLLTTKRRCDECRCDRYNDRGFHCASCNFFSCFDYGCHRKMLVKGNIRTIE